MELTSVRLVPHSCRRVSFQSPTLQETHPTAEVFGWRRECDRKSITSRRRLDFKVRPFSQFDLVNGSDQALGFLEDRMSGLGVSTLKRTSRARHTSYSQRNTFDFATLKWPHFDHYIWPHPNR